MGPSCSVNLVYSVTVMLQYTPVPVYGPWCLVGLREYLVDGRDEKEPVRISGAMIEMGPAQWLHHLPAPRPAEEVLC